VDLFHAFSYIINMKPPICHICREPLDENSGGLVYFKKTESDLEWERRMSEPGMVGHPPYATWFCGKHYSMADEYRELTLPEAVERIKDAAG